MPSVWIKLTSHGNQYMGETYVEKYSFELSEWVLDTVILNLFLFSLKLPLHLPSMLILSVACKLRVSVWSCLPMFALCKIDSLQIYSAGTVAVLAIVFFTFYIFLSAYYQDKCIRFVLA